MSKCPECGVEGEVVDSRNRISLKYRSRSRQCPVHGRYQTVEVNFADYDKLKKEPPMPRPGTKKARVEELLMTRPDLSTTQIAEIANIAATSVSTIKRGLRERGIEVRRELQGRRSWDNLTEKDRKLLTIIYRDNLVDAILDGE
jgi:hypothetical protein